MEPSRQANAAQLAQRNIKAKPKGRRLGGHGTPVGGQQQQQFSQNVNGGGLFGGSVQATGSFEFSAPTPGGISFPPSSFSSNQGSGDASDSMANRFGRFAGDDRASKKKFGKEPLNGEVDAVFAFPDASGELRMSNSIGDISVPAQAPISSNTGSFIFGNSAPAFTGVSQPSNPISNFGSNLNGGNPISNNSGSSIFNFNGGSTQPHTSTFNFGSTAQQQQPFNSPFQFNSTPASNTNSGTSFGSTATSSAPLFGSNPSLNAPSPSITNFGSTPSTTATSGNLFGTVQPSNPPSGSTMNFGSSNSAAPPKSYLFGSVQTTAPSSSSTIFGPITSTAAPTTSSIFGNTQTSTAPPSTFTNFGSTPTTPPTSNIFENTKTSTAPVSTFMGFSSAPAASPMSNLFGNKQISAAPPVSFTNFNSGASTAPSNTFKASEPSHSSQTSNMFGTTNQQLAPVPNPFASLSAPNSSASSPFGSREPSPATNGQDPQQSPSADNMFQSASKSSSSAFDGDSQKSSSSSLFGNLNKPMSANNSFNQSQHTASSSGTFGSSEQSTNSTKELFGTLNKPVDESVTQSKINGNIFGSQTVGQTSFDSNSGNSLFTKPAAQPTESSQSTSLGVKSTTGTAPASPGTSLFSTMNAPNTADKPPPSGMFPSLSQQSRTTENSNSFPTSQKPSSNTSPLLSIPPTTLRPPQDPISKLKQDFNALSKMADKDLTRDTPTDLDEDSRARFYAAVRLMALNKGMAGVFKAMTLDYDPILGFEFYKEQRQKILDTLQDTLAKRSGNGYVLSAAQPGSRDFVDELNAKRKSVDRSDEDNENPSKRSKNDANGSSSLDRSQSHVQTETPSAKDRSALNTSQPPTFALSPTVSSAPAISSIGPPSKSKRKAVDQLDQDTVEVSPLRKIKTPKSLATPGVSSNTGSSTSNIFKNILETPAKSSSGATSPEKKKIAPITKPAADDDKPHVNPFSSLMVPASPYTPKLPATSPELANKFSFQPSVAAPNPFQIKGAASATPTVSIDKPAAATSNQFQIKSVPSAPGEKTIKPPAFGSIGPTNFLAQFGQQAAKTAISARQKYIDHAVDEDFDEDDGISEEEFRAQKGKEYDDKLAETERLSKIGTGFKLKQPESAAKNTSETNRLPKPLFGENTPSQRSGSSVFSSSNGSRTPTPGPVGSSMGSVLDGHVSGKPAKFGGNIFGHLSDVDSGRDEDDHDSPIEDSDDDDSENKDPNYNPGSETGSGPGTPAEETGVGIASAKKRPFEFGSASGSSTPGGSLFGRIARPENSGSPQQSGTSTPSRSLFDRIEKDGDGNPIKATPKAEIGSNTPSRSLFDRIEKDSNGNPVRAISTEEKENTQPSTASTFNNPFRSLGGIPADQTWKPSSPIRFGSSTTAPAPSVSVTAATPTKPGSPSIFSNLGNPSPKSMSSLFGSASDSKPPVTFGSSSSSSLFGNLGGVKGPASANVGFGFGASSTTSSLLPSAAASGATSRATTPGATTDGDSGADGETEIHEQIDLTAGGPGEEDELVVYEVRARATKYNADKRRDGDDAKPADAWEIKGVGPLRILKHKDTGVSRILLRGDPSGKIILNKSLLHNTKYTAIAKQAKIMTLADNGEGLETWLLTVKTEEAAQALADALEENKPDN